MLPEALSAADTSHIIEMAWDDCTPFEAILAQFGLSEGETIALMRRELKQGSYRLWRRRVNGRKAKHLEIASAHRLYMCSLFSHG